MVRKELGQSDQSSLWSCPLAPWDWVRRWAEDWFGAGGVVHRWQIDDRFTAGDREVAQWTFECTWAGERTTFEGATVARVRDGLLAELREYQTTAPLYDWRGTWR